MPPNQHMIEVMQDLRLSWGCPCDPLSENLIGKIETGETKQIKKPFNDLFEYFTAEKPMTCPFFSFETRLVQAVQMELRKSNVSDGESILNDEMDPVIHEAIILFKQAFNQATSYFNEMAFEKQKREMEQAGQKAF